MPRRPDSQIQTAATKHAIHNEPTAPVGQRDVDSVATSWFQRHLAVSWQRVRREPGHAEEFLAGPGSFGLTGRELWAEGHRLLTKKSWQQWEIRARLADPRGLPELGWLR